MTSLQAAKLGIYSHFVGIFIYIRVTYFVNHYLEKFTQFGYYILVRQVAVEQVIIVVIVTGH